MILSFSFSRYATTVSGAIDLISPTVLSMTDTFFRISFLSFSPSNARIFFICSDAPDAADTISDFNASSSSSTVFVSITSAVRISAVTVKSSCTPYLSQRTSLILRYSFATSSFTESSTPSFFVFSYVTYTSKCPRLKLSIRTRLTASSANDKTLGSFTVTSKNLWLTLFISTVIFLPSDSATDLP